MYKTALVGRGMPKPGIERLQAQGYTVLILPTHPRLASPVADHPDTLVFRHRNTLITSKSYRDFAADLFDTLLLRHPSLSILCDPSDLSSPYPLDVRFNAVTIGNYLFGHPDHLSDALLAYARENGLTLCPVAQGYAGCSSAVLDGVLCSADLGILRAAERVGVKTLPIEAGGVSLPPYPYGFFGGAVAVTDDTVYTCGALETHPDAARIKVSITASGRRIVSLFDGALLDLGGLLLFDE